MAEVGPSGRRLATRRVVGGVALDPRSFEGRQAGLTKRIIESIVAHLVNPQPAVAAIAAGIADGWAPETRRAYAAVWDSWRRWAADAGVSALPAAPEHLLGWLSATALADDGRPQLSVSRVGQMLASVAAAHRAVAPPAGGPVENPASHPTVRRWVRDFRRRCAADAESAPRTAAPLRAADAAAIRAAALAARPTPSGRMESAQRAERRGTADRVIVGLLRDALLRRGEAAAVRWGDIEAAADGSGRLRVRPAHTDEHDERPELWLSPMTMGDIAAWRALQTAAGADTSADTQLLGLSGASIARRLDAAGRAAGLPHRLSGHSGRVGMTQDLIAAGAPLPAVTQAGRWASPQQPARYARRLANADNAVADWYAHHNPTPATGHENPQTRRDRNPGQSSGTASNEAT